MAVLTLAVLSLAASAARTSSGAGAAVDLTLLSDLSLEAATLAVDVGASSGGDATLTVHLETSPDGAAWSSLGSVDVTGTGRVEFARAGLLRYARARWVIGGTGSPSWTFAVGGQAAQVFAVPVDFAALGLAAEQWAGNETIVARQLLSATSLALDYLRGACRWTMPIVSWPVSLRESVAKIARYGYMVATGYDPEVPANGNWVDGYNQALGYLRDVASGRLVPELVDSTPTETETEIVMEGDTARGWGYRRTQ